MWDKVPTGKVRDQGDGEAAWLNVPGAMRIYRLLWDGICVGDAARSEVTRATARAPNTEAGGADGVVHCAGEGAARGDDSDPWHGRRPDGDCGSKDGAPVHWGRD